MQLDDLKPGQRYRVRKAPYTTRNRFVAGEIVTFASYTYNRYDDMPMFFFQDRPGTRRTFQPGDAGYNYKDDVVWCGAGSLEQMLADWETYFERID